MHQFKKKVLIYQRKSTIGQGFDSPHLHQSGKPQFTWLPCFILMLSLFASKAARDIIGLQGRKPKA